MAFKALLVAGAVLGWIAPPAIVLSPSKGFGGFRYDVALAAGQDNVNVGWGEKGQDGKGQDGKSGHSGKPGKDGRDGKDGKPGKPGKPGKDGKPGGGNGKPGNGKPGNGKGACKSPCKVPADVRKLLDSILDTPR